MVPFVFGEIYPIAVQLDPNGKFGQVVVVQSVALDALPTGLSAYVSVDFYQSISEHLEPGFKHACFLTKLAHPCTP
jgi:hypothetical protein